MGYWTLRYWLWALGDKERERLHGGAAVFFLHKNGGSTRDLMARVAK